MSTDQGTLVIDHQPWADGLDHPVPAQIADTAESGLPVELQKMRVRLGIQRWPDGREEYISVELGTSLLEVMRHGAKHLGEELLPPHSELPLDFLRSRRHDEWSAPISALDLPLWLYIVRGGSRRFGIECRRVIRINAKWGVANSPEMTPRQLLESFGFSPNDFTLYRCDSRDPLPPDTPIHLRRGEHFEAQKDGRYGNHD
jgi:hypothetical protein